MPHKHRADANAYNKRYYAANKEKIIAQQAASRARRPDALRVSRRKWRGLPAPTRPEPAECEICKHPPDGPHKAMCLDHCHETKRFRGWLCWSCNILLGVAVNDADILARAAAYLRKFEK